MKTRQRFLILHLALALLSGCATVWTVGEVPFIPTPMDVVDRMLDLAEVRKGDVIYDIPTQAGAATRSNESGPHHGRRRDDRL